MDITTKKFFEEMNQYGINVDCKTSMCIHMGEGNFAENGEKIGTPALISCIGLIAYCDDFAYVAHVDLGNKIGINFDNQGNSIRLAELYKRILVYKQSGGKSLYFGTVSSESFIFDKKWWSKGEIIFENQIDSFIKLCKEEEIDIIRLPHIKSSFVLIDSSNGNYYVDDWGCCVEKNFNDSTKQKFLTLPKNNERKRLPNEFIQINNERKRILQELIQMNNERKRLLQEPIQMNNENFNFQDIISSLEKILTEEYDNYENGNRDGALIETEKFDGFIRIGKALHYGQGEIVYMKNDGRSIVIRDKDCFVNIDGKNDVSIKSIKPDSNEFEFINQTIEIGNAKAK